MNKLQKLIKSYEIEEEAHEITKSLLEEYGYNLLSEYMPCQGKTNLNDIIKVKEDLEEVHLITFKSWSSLDVDRMFPNVEYLFDYEKVLDRMTYLGWIDIYEEGEKEKNYTKITKIIVIKGPQFSKSPTCVRSYFSKPDKNSMVYLDMKTEKKVCQQ